MILFKITNGINFWIDDNINKIFKDLVFKIEINHEWNGLTPNLINILIIIKIFKVLIIISKKKNLNKNITDANLWTKKYFIEFSISIFSLVEIIGKNLSIFNSSLIHIIKLELNLIDIIIEKRLKNKNLKN